MSKIHKAVFPVAGMGTRFLPATKASPKEMLPVVDKPLIQYAAEEAVMAGIDTLVFITGRHKRSIEDHFDKAYELETELNAEGKNTMLNMVQNILPKHVKCIYIRQSEPLGLGHAVLCAKPVVGDDPFAVILADDLIDDGGSGCLAQMIDVYENAQCGVVGVQEVDKKEVKSYGVISGKQIQDNLWDVDTFVEKPEPKDAPSNVAVVGRYILEPSIFNILEQTGEGAGGEIQLTDALATQAKSEKLLAYKFDGKRYDCGSKLGYLEATVELAMKHNGVGKRFTEYLKQLNL
ncbi:MAG: UTP--glucose-1-phosphate uridylyltransferase GalU [Gammaproteobacteria bacterium]|nr:UTP--glucose-1-phosphate uridylyltransferase GalU [Gammaproteobacteria bacterium]NNC67469.1 UTP--glucose-1-phosphate uridylyltransferase GalU [Gammaproteobacteria bacterium]